MDGITPAVPEPKTSKELRQMVQNQLNVRYSLAIGEPYTKVPYTKLSTNNVIGWPPSVQLRLPSVLTADQLKIVYDNIDAIKFVRVPPHVPVTAMDHCYCKPSAGVAAMELKTRSIGHTCLAVEPETKWFNLVDLWME